MGSLTWNASETAEFYIVTAESSTGHKVQLSTNETWTFISEFLCGQEYFLSVQAVDSVCTSQPSLTSKLISGSFNYSKYSKACSNTMFQLAFQVMHFYPNIHKFHPKNCNCIYVHTGDITVFVSPKTCHSRILDVLDGRKFHIKQYQTDTSTHWWGAKHNSNN